MSLIVDIRKNLGDFTLDVVFETGKGITGILGPSGGGKSLTLKCIAGIEKPDSGRIILDGVTLFDSEKGINLPPQKRRVGYLFQNYALFPNMTVKQNIMCGLCIEKDKREKRRKYSDIIKLMQLDGLENRKPSQLSGGQQQRAALARILVNEPKLLMLDEPFSALDTHLRGKLQIETKALLRDYGRDVLIVTHSRDEAYHLCDDIAVISDGTLAAKKATKELFADPGSVAAAMITGCKNIALARKVGEFEVEVPEWGGLRFITKAPVRDELKAIGIRAHYFNPATPHNRHAVIYKGEMEEIFETIILFRFAEQSEDSPDVWWRLSKDKRPKDFPSELGIAPANILLLY